MPDTIRTVFLGAGRRGTHYARLLQGMPEFKVTAAADVNPLHFDHHAKSLGSPTFYDDWRKLLDAEDFELACIASPDHLHEEMALEVLARGKHLLLEKPMALTPQGCLNIIKAQRDTNAKLLICFVLRYHELYKKAKALVADGAIGAVKAVWVQHSVMLNYFHNWMSERDKSGGLLLQKGSHDIDIVNWITDGVPTRVSAFCGLDHFGGDADNKLICPECDKKDDCPDSWFKKNQAVGYLSGNQAYSPQHMRCAYRKEINVHDNHFVNIEYEGGMKASYNECHFTPIDRRHFTFIGEEGQIITDSTDNTVTLIKRHAGKREIFNVKQGTGGHGGGDHGLMQDVRNCLLEEADPIAGARAGFLSILCSEAGERSAATGQVIDVQEHVNAFNSLMS